MSYRQQRTIILATVGIVGALLWSGCDRPQSTTANNPTVVRKKGKLDKSAPVSERVKAIIAEQLVPKNELKSTDRIVEDLGGDSLDCVELIMAFEEEFSLEIPDNEAVKLKTVGDCVSFLERAAAKKHAK